MFKPFTAGFAGLLLLGLGVWSVVIWALIRLVLHFT